MTVEIPELKDLVSEVRSFRSELAEVKSLLLGAAMSRSDIAKDLGCSAEWLRLHPWALPNFSRPDIPGRPEKWFRSTWEAWKPGMEAHRRRWEAMSARDRAIALQRSA